MSSDFEGIDFSGLEKLEKRERVEPETGDTAARQDVLLSDIIEDADQPRRFFDDDALKDLAASIKSRGVLQAITVRPLNAEGKHMIVVGERRVRAARLAGLERIPAFVRTEPTDIFDQMIENIQRENLTNTEIAQFVGDAIEQGRSASEIASTLGKSRSWVSLYAAFPDMHEVIQDNAEKMSIRSAYELHQAFQKDADATLEFIEERPEISEQAARSFRKSLTEVDSEGGKTKAEGENSGHDAAPEKVTRVESKAIDPEPGRVMVAIIISVNNRIGRLMMDQVSEAGPKFGVVSFGNGSVLSDVALSDMELVEIIGLD